MIELKINFHEKPTNGKTDGIFHFGWHVILANNLCKFTGTIDDDEDMTGLTGEYGRKGINEIVEILN